MTSRAISEHAHEVLTYVRKHAKQRCSEIAAALGVENVVISAHLRALRAAGLVRSKGNTRGTVWLPVVK